jgi:hypothetical protein
VTSNSEEAKMPFGSGTSKIFPNLTYQCNPRIASILQQFSNEKTILDMGAGGREIAPHVKAVDFEKCPNTDIICDVCKVPLDEERVDLIIATGLLEHV